MKWFFPILVLYGYPVISHADALQFEPPFTVTTASTGVFIHLDSSGRRSLAVSDGLVAVVWEDNRSGQPGIYIAYRIPGKIGFTKPEKISNQKAGYEPAITALAGQRFLVAWEEDNQVWLRVMSSLEKGQIVSIGKAPSKQISVATDSGDKAGTVWSQVQRRDTYVYYADVKIDGHAIHPGPQQLVDNSDGKNVQQYPALVFSTLGRVVAWEDRRHGNTRIFVSFAANDQLFQQFQLLNEFAPPPNPELGKGSGAMRPTLAGDGKQAVIAAWMDKRNWRGGYDVFAAVSAIGGKTFGKNEQAQDMFGENVPQWHASVAQMKNADIAAVAWDDTRNESPDVFYSLRFNGEWSDDYELPGATGPGHQSHPSISFDEKGLLHAVWLNNIDGQTTLQYTRSVK